MIGWFTFVDLRGVYIHWAKKHFSSQELNFKIENDHLTCFRLYLYASLLIPIFVVLYVLQEDPVLLVPENQDQKPYVAVIKVGLPVDYFA